MFDFLKKAYKYSKGGMDSLKELIKAKIKVMLISALPWILLILVVIAAITSMGDFLSSIWENFIGGILGSRYTISDNEAQQVIDEMLPIINEIGFNEKGITLTKNDIKYYMAAELNSYKPFKVVTLNRTVEYSVSDPAPGYSKPSNESTPVNFDEREMLRPYVLGADFYIALDVGTQNTKFAKECGETSSRGGFEMIRSDATFIDIYDVKTTVTTVPWTKNIYTSVTDAEGNSHTVFSHTEYHTMIITRVEKIPKHVLTEVKAWSKLYKWEYAAGQEEVRDYGEAKTTSVEYQLVGALTLDNSARFEELVRKNNINPDDFNATLAILETNKRNVHNLQDLKYIQAKISGEAYEGGTGGIIDFDDIPLKPGDSAAADVELTRYPLPQIYQHDARWASTMYSSINDPNQTIKTSGCGPSSAAIVLTGMTGKVISPPEACAFSLANGYRTPSSGTSWAFFGAYAKKFGISVRQITFSNSEKYNFRSNGMESDNIKAIKQALTNKDPIIISQSAGYWTSQGHFHVWGGFDSQGKVIIIDPMAKSGHFTLSAAIENAAAAFIFTK